MNYLVHSSNKFINFFFSITPVSSILERVIFITPSSSWIIHLKSPKKRISFFKMRSYSINFFNSSTQLIPYLPKDCSIIILSLKGILA